jgi:hypothetical protein
VSASDPLELVLYESGGAQLERGDAVLWDSLADDEFRDQFPDEFLTESDVGGILEYLVKTNRLTNLEADDISVSYDDGPDDPGDDGEELNGASSDGA